MKTPLALCALLACSLTLTLGPSEAEAQEDNVDGNDIALAVQSSTMGVSATAALLIMGSFTVMLYEDETRIDELYDEAALYDQLALLELYIEEYGPDVWAALVMCDASVLTEVMGLMGHEWEPSARACARLRAQEGARAQMAAGAATRPRLARARALRAAMLTAAQIPDPFARSTP